VGGRKKRVHKGYEGGPNPRIRGKWNHRGDKFLGIARSIEGDSSLKQRREHMRKRRGPMIDIKRRGGKTGAQRLLKSYEGGTREKREKVEQPLAEKEVGQITGKP